MMMTMTMMVMRPPQVSRRTAQRDLVRGMKFLSTLSRVPEIRAALDQGAGYTEEDHARGWDLLLTAMGYARSAVPAPAPVPSPQQSALAELDEWDGINFDRTRATLRYAFPDQYDYVFRGLSAAVGADTIGSVQTFVDRVVALRDGTDPAREDTRAADEAAAERLVERKIFNPEIQAYLEGLLEQAKQLAPAPKSADSDDAIQRAADDLHVWLSDWTGQARAFITRGDYLIRLGLSTRKSRVDDEDEEESEEVMTEDEATADTVDAIAT